MITLHPVTRSRHADRLIDRQGVRDILPVLVGVIPFAAVIGVNVAQTPAVPVWAGLLTGPLMYAGSAHLAAVTLLHGGAGLVTVVATVAIINARLSLYGAVIEPRFRSQPGWFRWLAPHFLVDQTFVLATARPPDDDPRRFRRYWITAGTVLGVGWTSAMVGAALLGPSIPADSPLTFASIALFIGLLTPRLREPSSRLPAAVAALVAVVAAPLPNGLALPVAIAAALVPSLVRGSTS